MVHSLFPNMNDDTLTQLINRANGLPGPQIIFTRPLAANVHVALAWLAAPSLADRAHRTANGYNIYLIQNAAGVFAAAVLDMGEDLHWLVRKPFRGQGWLTNALRQVILPHLLQSRERQIISISKGLDVADRLASEKVARDTGFVLLEDSAHERKFAFQPTEAQPEMPELTQVKPTMTEERLEELQHQLAYHAACLRLIQAEVAWTLAEGPVSEGLGDLAEEIQDHAGRLETVWFA